MRILFLFFIAGTIASCTAPLPVYFDKPIGVAVDSFPASIQGNYYPAEEVIEKGMTVFEGPFRIRNGKIVLNDTAKAAVSSGNNKDAKVQETLKDAGPQPESEENNFYKIANLNPLSYSHVDSAADVIDKEKKIVFSFLKITKDRISFIIRDSSAGNHNIPLFILGSGVKLTFYSEDHYLNIQTPYGWEYLKLEEWNKGEFLNIVPFYFTNYDNKTGDEKVFLRSTAAIYPNLKPIYNEAHLIIGVKGKSDPKTVKERFKKAENNFELIKVR